jgi:hypothetical protein
MLPLVPADMRENAGRIAAAGSGKSAAAEVIGTASHKIVD